MQQQWMQSAVNLHPVQSTERFQAVLVIPWLREKSHGANAPAVFFTDSNLLEQAGRKIGLLNRCSAHFVDELVKQALSRHSNNPDRLLEMQVGLKRLFQEAQRTPFKYESLRG